MSFRSSLTVLQGCASENIQHGLFKIILYDGMFCVGIAAAEMNRFKGGLYNFASATQGFLRQHSFQLSIIPVEFSLKDRRAQNLQFFELLNVQTLIPRMQPMKLLRQLKGSASAAVKSPCHCRDAR